MKLINIFVFRTNIFTQTVPKIRRFAYKLPSEEEEKRVYAASKTGDGSFDLYILR